MQSLLQYRRLRQGVLEDMLRNQNIEQPAGSSTGTSAMNPDTELRASVEEQSKNHALFPGVTVLHTDGISEEGVVFIVKWKDNDPNNPQHWSLTRKWMATLTCCVIGIAKMLAAGT